MKKLIPKGNLSRYSKLIIDAGNLTNCYEETGVLYETLSVVKQLGLNKCRWSEFKLAMDMAVINNLAKPIK